jgi:RNA polymerase-binding protein DksA
MKTHSSQSAANASSEQIDPKWSWHYRTLLAMRERLLQTRTLHENAATAAAEKRNVDFAEIAQEETDLDIILAELHGESDRIQEIDAALQRIRTGTYGICEETGQPISPDRLRAIPWTRYSRSAAERSEQSARQNRSTR